MKEDNISQLGDYGAPFCEQEYTHGSCYISLFKFRSFDQFKVQMKCFFIAESERAAKIRKIAVYRSLISLLVQEL